MRKKFTALTAVAAAMFLAAGCSGQADNHTSDTQSPSQTETSAETEEANKTTVSQETGKTEAADRETEETGKTETGKQENVETPDSAGDEAKDQETEDMGDDWFLPLKIWGDITEVADGAIYVDNQSENSSRGEIILMVDPETTRVLDGENGFPVAFEDIEKGRFEAYLGPAMTMSLPPQATAVMVIVNIPEESPAAQYVIAAGEIEEKDGEKTLAGKDGTEYVLSPEVSITPFLTRQIVALEDIQAGSECLVWLGEKDTVERIVLFNQ